MGAAENASRNALAQARTMIIMTKSWRRICEPCECEDCLRIRPDTQEGTVSIRTGRHISPGRWVRHEEGRMQIGRGDVGARSPRASARGEHSATRSRAAAVTSPRTV
eukprot:1444529-Prymnesium_polylepis.1